MTLQRKIKGILQIFRPELPLAAGLCVVIGQLLALGTFPPLGVLGPGFACGFLLSASALIFNDYFDLAVDRINAPQRPLPAGRLSPREVLALGGITALAGLAAAGALNPLALGVSVVVWLLGFWYNWKLKAAGLWGNLIVSTSVAMTFVLGGIGAGQVWNRTVWVFGLIAFVFDLGEEIAADAMDAAGDQQRASKSVAIVRGKQTALRLSGLLFGTVVVLTFVPVVWGGLGGRYLLAALFIDALISFFTVKLLRSQTIAEGRWAVRGLYLSASVGLLAFVIGSFFR
jgi:geranylgeranylglycerol-phosphate geranylgeranyltransferase